MKPTTGTVLPTKRGIIDYLNQLDHKLSAQGTKAAPELFDISFHYSYTTNEITGFGACRTKDTAANRTTCHADFAIQILGCEFSWHGDDVLHDKGGRSYTHPPLEDGIPLVGEKGEALDMERELCHALDTHIETLCPCHQAPLLSREHVLDALESVDALGESFFIRFGGAKTGPVLFIENKSKRTRDLIPIDLETAADLLMCQKLPLEIRSPHQDEIPDL